MMLQYLFKKDKNIGIFRYNTLIKCWLLENRCFTNLKYQSPPMIKEQMKTPKMLYVKFIISCDKLLPILIISRMKQFGQFFPCCFAGKHWGSHCTATQSVQTLLHLVHLTGALLLNFVLLLEVLSNIHTWQSKMFCYVQLPLCMVYIYNLRSFSILSVVVPVATNRSESPFSNKIVGFHQF